MSAKGFAVIDVETTGLFSHGSHRIAELAVVHVDPDGTITGTWESLVNPQRDLGPQHIHGILAADVMDAPTFEQIAPHLVELLADRVIVAHNASFDMGFLSSEFERMNYWFSARALCTMQLARQFLSGAGRSLNDCCDAYGIVIDNAHRASADAFATAELLSAYINDSPMWAGWREPEYIATLDLLPANGVVGMPRRTAGERQPSFLERITIKLPDYTGPAESLDYLALLDLSLLDHHISAHEANDLVQLAETKGISRETCAALHLEYFDQLVNAAWADAILTDDERATLIEVGRALGVSDETIEAGMVSRVVSAAPSVSSFALAVGDLVVLTGEMRRPREQWENELTARGYVPWSGVTKKVKLVAAADPDSLSGKARKARDYGIPIVDEAGLGALLGT
jgi:DNA polymerase III subunit epsilon